MVLMNRELLLQEECFAWRDKLWLKEQGVFAYRGRVFRIKNELDNFLPKHLHLKQLGSNASTGITKGIWDELIMRNPRTWIEYKIPPNVLSTEQKAFAKIGTELGDIFFVVTSLESYQDVYYGLIACDY